MEDNTLKFMMIGILVIFTIGFSFISYFLIREIFDVDGEERNRLLFKIEVGLLSISSIALVTSFVSLLNFM